MAYWSAAERIRHNEIMKRSRELRERSQDLVSRSRKLLLLPRPTNGKRKIEVRPPIALKSRR